MRTSANSFFFYSLSIALQPHTTSQSEYKLLRLIVYRLNAITAFSQKILESQTKTHSDAKNIVRLSHKPDIEIEMLFSFLDLNTCSAPLSLSERQGSEIKQLSDAFGMARKQSYYLPFVEKSTSYCGL